MRRSLIVVLLLCLAVCLWGSNLQQKTLPNGMRVVAKRVPSNGTVGLYCYVKTGSAYEGKHLGSGISHYVEHLVSGGSSTKRSEAEYNELSTQMGADVNAGTTQTYTEYHQIVHRDYFDLALQILAEQMQFCSFDSTQVAREKQVISKEIVMGQTSPLSKAHHRANEVFFANSNLQYPIIGHPDLFVQITRNDLIEYYHKRYVPNNMIFVVAGDIDPTTAISAVEREFEGFARRNLEPVYLPAEQLVSGKPNFIEEFDLQFPMVRINQVLPPSAESDCYPLDIALDYLINRDTAPLKKKLVEQLKLVNYIYAYTFWQKESSFGSMQISFEAKNTADIPKILDIMYQEFGKYQKGFFTQAMINTQIKQLEAANLLHSQSVEDICEIIGEAMIDYGVPDISTLAIEHYRQLKPQDVNNVVKTYLQPLGKKTFYALPLGETELLEQGIKQTGQLTQLGKTELGNGLTLLHKQNSSLPKITVDVFVPISDYYENAERRGCLELMCGLLFSGSQKYPPKKLSDWLEDHYIWLDARLVEQGFQLRFSCLRSDLPEMQKIICDAFAKPLFSEGEFVKQKEAWEAHLIRAKSNPGAAHDEFVAKSIYADKRSRMTTADILEVYKPLTRNDMVATYHQYFRASEAYVALVGDVNHTEAKRFASEIYKAINHKQIDGVIAPPQLSLANQTHLQEYGYEEANIKIYTKAPLTGEADYMVMRVINYLLNYGQRRLHNATRVERDLVYYAYSYPLSNPLFGAYVISSQTTREKIPELQRVLEAELDKLINVPVSQEEIDLAIDDFLKQSKNEETDDNIGGSSIRREFYGLGYDFLDKGKDLLGKVSPEDIQRVAREYFSIRDAVISIPSDEVERMVNE